MNYTTQDFDFDLPEELIAQTPLKDRTSSRLLVVNETEHSVEDKHFSEIIDYLEEGDTLVVNNTRVLPARLYGEQGLILKCYYYIIRMEIAGKLL